MFIIRRSTLEDVPALSPLFDAYRVFYRQDSNPEAAASFLTDRITRNESVIFLAFDQEDCLAGFLQLYPLFSSTRMQRLWLLNDLFVQPANRGKGISTLLIEASKSYCIETKACGLLLETEISNEIAKHLYEATGFELDKSHDYYYWQASGSG